MKEGVVFFGNSESLFTLAEPQAEGWWQYLLLAALPWLLLIGFFIYMRNRMSSQFRQLSSGWIHRIFPDLKLFSWQDGYAVFGVSPSVIKHVYRYIEQQERHHQKLDSRQELIRLLQKHGIPYDPEHV
ncbi:MAG: transposase [Acidobacteria bacterium]|nr:transposase [Acidobacteriota bacterium]